MKLPVTLLTAAFVLAAAQNDTSDGSSSDGPTGILGFNSGAMFDTSKAKKKSDFLEEFKTAQSLHGSPGLFNSVRLYTMIQWETDDTPIEAFEAAIETNTTMLLGIWCSGTDSIEKELNAMKSALDKYGTDFANLVVAISVGSEDMYRVSETGIKNNAGLGQDAETIVGFIDDVRAAVKGTLLEGKMIGHVDTWSAWANESNSDVIDAVDFVGVDLYPYYEDDKGNAFSNNTNVYDYIYGLAAEAAGDKPLWVTETGWPSSGPTWGEAEATTENAAQYWQDIGCNKLFGRINVWWYNLRDSNPANKEKFAITTDLDASNPNFNLTCKADSGAPAAINTESGSNMLRVSLGAVAGVALSVVLGVIG